MTPNITHLDGGSKRLRQGHSEFSPEALGGNILNELLELGAVKENRLSSPVQSGDTARRAFH